VAPALMGRDRGLNSVHDSAGPEFSFNGCRESPMETEASPRQSCGEHCIAISNAFMPCGARCRSVSRVFA